jgi:glycosyltransferase involved in cell wall biosynthesis
MRVGLVVYGDLDRRSGGYLYDFEVASRLRAAGDEVTVCSLPETTYRRSLAHNVSPGVRRQLRRVAADVDVLLVDELCHPSLAWALSVVPGDTPVVALVHHLRWLEPGPLWRRRLTRTLERRFLRATDATLATNRTTLHAVGALAAPGPATVAHPAGDRFDTALTPDTVRRRARDGPLRLVFVGNVTPRKGLDTLVDGLSRTTCPWELRVVGSREADPAYVRSVADLARSAGVADRVSFLGRVDDGRLADVLAESHVLAVPSAYEGFGIVYLEGMGFGLPALATSAGGASELVTHRRDGWLVDPGDPADVADALAPVCRDRERLARMGVAALGRYRAHPTWDDTAETVRSFLHEVVTEY